MEQTSAFLDHRNLGTCVPDEILLRGEDLERFKQDLRDETSGAGRSERHQYLKSRYWDAPRVAFRNLQVRWDYRRAALRLNWELFDRELPDYHLYEADSALLRSKLWDKENYDVPLVYQKAEWYVFLPVVDRWEIGAPLTPPALEVRPDGNLEKRDGFHRLAVALLAAQPAIPFWANLALEIPGLRRLPES